MELLTNEYERESVAFRLVESVNEIIVKYEIENKRISDKGDREEFKSIQSDIEGYGNRIVKSKLIVLLSSKSNSEYENNLKKLRDSVMRMIVDNNQLSNKKINQKDKRK